MKLLFNLITNKIYWASILFNIKYILNMIWVLTFVASICLNLWFSKRVVHWSANDVDIMLTLSCELILSSMFLFIFILSHNCFTNHEKYYLYIKTFWNEHDNLFWMNEKKGVKQIYMAFSFVGKSKRNMLVEVRSYFSGTYIVHINLFI